MGTRDVILYKIQAFAYHKRRPALLTSRTPRAMLARAKELVWQTTLPPVVVY